MLSDTYLIAEEACLPHMMELTMGRLIEEGFEVRLDARGHLNNSMMVILQKDTELSHAAALAADDMATSILKEVSFDRADVALLAVSYFVLKLVDEQLHPDPKSQSVLVALMIVADAEPDENPDLHKLVPMAKEKAGKMLDVCLARGMFKWVQVH